VEIATELRSVLGSAASVIDDPQVLVAYERDQAPFAPSTLPSAVLVARSVEEIAATAKFASERHIPLVVRGAGSGLAGGANAIAGSIVISLEKLDQIIDLDPVNQIARVQAGVINKKLDEAAAKFGLAYLPDPASREWSTLGGNIATNAGGMCCVKYGVTAQHVRSIKVVLASGEIIEFGFPTRKAVTSLNLRDLFIGSEGTLGIIVEATLALAPRPKPPITLIATFPNAVSAATAASKMLPLTPSMLELMDRTTLATVEGWKPMGFEACEALLIMQSDQSANDCERAQAIAIECGAIDAQYSDDPKDSELLIQVRKLAYPALERSGVALLDDVVVPISKIAELVEGVEAIAARNEVLIGLFGHAGDGNMHPTIVYSHQDKAAEARALTAFNEIIALAQELGGTASGEHGIGALKVSAVENELSPSFRKLQREIKEIFDPNQILNPGKKFPLK